MRDIVGKYGLTIRDDAFTTGYNGTTITVVNVPSTKEALWACILTKVENNSIQQASVVSTVGTL
ncbi:MAG: hypothetical protein HY516_01270 [Candidatus Aenigmarchaeota archaeon]|nr:hypothetical protein [Candidatus Aenigmarchaeota archaeon]